MLWYFVLGTFAAFGALCVLWALLGWLLPGGKGSALVCFGLPDEEILTRIKWLRSMGLLNIPLLVVAEEPGFGSAEMEICTGEELLSRLKQERKQYDGTGNGDSSGRHQRRGISEL